MCKLESCFSAMLSGGETYVANKDSLREAGGGSFSQVQKLTSCGIFLFWFLKTLELSF